MSLTQPPAYGAAGVAWLAEGSLYCPCFLAPLQRVPPQWIALSQNMNKAKLSIKLFQSGVGHSNKKSIRAEFEKNFEQKHTRVSTAAASLNNHRQHSKKGMYETAPSGAADWHGQFTH